MIGTILKKVFGTANERELKRLQVLVDDINGREEAIVRLSDAELRAKTDEFKKRLEGDETLDDILPEAFAVVREASKRTLGMRHFDAQLIGGIVLHKGRIAEMKTGEGKTLVATLPVYLNALSGKGVHVVTVNDYLARRDAQWMSPIYTFLGLTVGVIVHGLTDEQRKAGLRLRHHLRHEQRVRVRLSPGQHEVRSERLRAARAQLRHRRRGRLDPDRRGQDAADHLRSDRGFDGQILQDQPHHPESPEGRGLYHRGKDQDRGTDRRRQHQGREAARRGQPLRSFQRRPGPPRAPGPQGPCAVPPRRGLRGQGRRGDDRRRVHGPADAGQALERRTAPGHRGQGRRQDREREPDPRLDHVPELLPALQQARRHDRNGRDRGRGVREDLQPRRGRDPHAPSHDPQGQCRFHLQDRRRPSSTPPSTRSRNVTRTASPSSSAPSPS